MHSRGLGPHGWRGIADLLLTLHQPAVSACGRGRPRIQDARGSLMLPTCCPLLSAVRTPEAPQGLPRTQGGLQPARATPRPRRRASPWKLEEYTDRHGYDGSARMLMSFVWNSLDLPCRARRPLSATCAAPSNRPYERCAPYLRVSTPPCEPVRRTLRAQRCPSIARSALK